MESEKLHIGLISLIDDFQNLNSTTHDGNEIKVADEERAKTTLCVEIKYASKLMYQKSHEEKYYWNFCSFLTYKDSYESRLTAFAIRVDEEVESCESSFIKAEILSIINGSNFEYFKCFDKSIQELIKIADDKKLVFLNEKLNSLNKLGIKDELVIDLDDTTATDKIIYLKQLGILDFLKHKTPFNSSVNLLATVLSAITGEKRTTLQPMLNPIFSPLSDPKKNPLTKSKNVLKVKKNLNDIGFVE